MLIRLYLLPLVFLLLIPDLSFAQNQWEKRNMGVLKDTAPFTPRRRYEAPRSRKHNPKQTIPPKHIRIDEETSLLFDAKGVFIYMGGIGQLKDGKLFPYGTGIVRTVVNNIDTGDSAYEYCLCPWKRGSRHGEGIMKLPDGTYRKVRWKWGRLKSASDEPPLPEEIEALEQKIDRLERILQIL